MKIQTTLLDKRRVMDETWVLTLEKKDMNFEPGQYIHLAAGQKQDRREYSIYSSPYDPILEVLIKRQSSGDVSPRLCDCSVGDKLEMEGPGGNFTLSKEDREKPVIMMATGSGISPFASLVRSYPDLDYSIIHGLQTPAGLDEFRFLERDRYTQCTSRSLSGDYHGRVTGYLSQSEIPANGIFMLCGNSDMIYEAMGILQSRGVGPSEIRGEIYF